MNYLKRVKKVLNKLDNVDYLFINTPEDVFYLSGCFEKDAYGVLDVVNEKFLMLCDSRISLMAKKNIKNGEVIEYESLEEVLKQEVLGICGFIKKNITYDVYEKLSFLEIVFLEEDIIKNVRMYKEQEEIDLIQESCEITDKVFEKILKNIKIGITEKELSRFIRRAFEDYGVDDLSFPSIVAFGENSACPHHQNTNKKLEYNMPILIDMGGMYQNYASDMTRMIWFGSIIDEEFQRDYDAVLEAQEKAIMAFEKGVLGKDVDSVARNVLEKYNLEKYFTHSLGHGVGINVHDGGKLSKISDIIIKQGFVSSVEPGIYREGMGNKERGMRKGYGIRIEDVVVLDVETNKVRVLSKTDKKIWKVV